MPCPECGSTNISKNGKQKGKHASHLQGVQTTVRLKQISSLKRQKPRT